MECAYVHLPREGSHGRRTEPSQYWHIFQTLLRRHGAVRWEDMTQEQHIQLRLVVTHEHRRPGPSNVVFLVIDLEPHAGEQQHHPLEGFRGRPLSQPTVSRNVETC